MTNPVYYDTRHLEQKRISDNLGNFHYFKLNSQKNLVTLMGRPNTLQGRFIL